MRLALALVASLVGSTALAQDVPTVSNEPGVQGLPDEASFDVLGIKLGMTAEEAQASTKKELRPVQKRIFLSDPKTGGEFQLEYDGALESVSPPLIGNQRFTAGQDEVTVEMGTAAVGNRVVSIRRFLSPPEDQPISMEAFRGLLRDKYGEPSGVNARGDSLAWIYGKDGKVTVPFWSDEIDYQGLMSAAEAGAKPGDELTPPPCTLSFRSGVSDGLNPYEYQPERELRDPDCVAGLLVKLQGGNTLQNATILMVDGQRRIQNAEGLDQAVEAALSGGGSPKNAPEL